MIQAIARVLVIGLVPLAGLAGLWATSESLSRQGTDWEVDIQGYDPRDLLRGHYVEFTYDWPMVAAETEDDGVQPAFWRSDPAHLCLIGEAPFIAEAIPFEDPADPGFAQCEHKLSAQIDSVYGARSLARGRLYVGQDRALVIEEELRNREQRGVVTFRQREDGVLTPLDIRFRPLTPEEREELEATRAAPLMDLEGSEPPAENE